MKNSEVPIRQRSIPATAVVGFFLAASSPALAFTPVEQVRHYSISGQNGSELYASIGTNGPVISDGRRTIAHTTFKLTWRRNYQPQADGSCVLVTAKPRLIITYTLPRPRGKLPGPVASGWKRFADGLAAHERVHGEQIVDMVSKIKAVSTGLRASGDPNCQKVRAQLQQHLKRLSDARQAESRDFDRRDMGAGGAIQRLILNLISGR